jgi:FkbM family methyltransferase
MQTELFIRELYRLALGREADPDGLAAWTAAVKSTSDPTIVLEGILGSEEYRRRNNLAAIHADFCHKLVERLKGHEITIVDVGAQLLGFERHIYSPLCDVDVKHRIIGFEPLANKLTERVNAEGNGSLVMLPDAIGDGTEQTLYINNRDATSSLFPLDELFCADFEDIRSLRTVDKMRVTTTALDQALTDHVGVIDFLKLDIQGAELMALKGAEQTLNRTAAIHCEVEFSAIYKDQPLFPEIQTFLNARGFDLIDLLIPHRYSYDVPSQTKTGDRLIWADAFFLRDSSDDVICLSQALTSLLVYGKATLAEHLFLRSSSSC